MRRILSIVDAARCSWRRLLCLSVCMAALAACVTPQSSQRYSATRYDSPLRSVTQPETLDIDAISRRARNGNAEAQYRLGHLYLNGDVEDGNRVDGVPWIVKAAEAGYLPAQTRLGTLYAEGVQFERDLATARLWWSRSAEHGNAEAQYRLADSLESESRGDGDLRQALFWARLALRSRFLTGTQRANASRIVREAERDLPFADRAHVKRKIAAWTPRPTSPDMRGGDRNSRIARNSLRKEQGRSRKPGGNTDTGQWKRFDEEALRDQIPAQVLAWLKSIPPQKGQEFLQAEKALAGARLAAKEGRFDRARADLRRAQGMASELGSTVLTARIELLHAAIEMNQRNFGIAVSNAERAIVGFDRLGLNEGSLRSRMLIADIHLLLDEFDKAKERLVSAMPFVSSNTQATTVAFLHERLGVVYLKEKNLMRSVAHFEMAHKSSDGTGDPERLAGIKVMLGMTYVLIGKPDEACGYWRDGLEMHEALGLDEALAKLHPLEDDFDKICDRSIIH